MNDVEIALASIARWKIVFVQDRRFPDLAGLLAGAPIRGSWWGHPASQRIFDTYGALEDRPDVARAKLLDGKVCLVHRDLFGALAAVGGAREAWQLDGIDADARALLDGLDEAGRLRASGRAVKALELRLLAYADQVHTESGAHATELSTWARFVETREVDDVPTAAQGRAAIEAAVDALAGAHGKRPRLPWPVPSSAPDGLR